MSYAPPRLSSDADVYAFVARHLLRQGAESVDAHGCAYRGRDGCMCAIGCLIADEHYSPDLERCSVIDYTGNVMAAVTRSIGAVFPEADLLVELQAVHDTRHPEAWPTLLRQVAEKWGFAEVAP